MNEADKNLKSIIFKACLVAVWTDSSMASDERRYLSDLIETLGEDEQERQMLRELRSTEPDENQVLHEVAQLDKQEKEYLFDTCMGILTSDRRLRISELRFLSTLRKTCRISIWSYYVKRIRALKKAKAIVSLNVRVMFLFLGIFLFIVLYSVRQSLKNDVGSVLKETNSGKEIFVSTLSPADIKTLNLSSSEEVFDHIQDSIVSVKVFRNNQPICSGSGSVIGSDLDGIIYVITNRHVIKNSIIKKKEQSDRIRVEVQQYSGAKFDAELDFYSREHDIAMLAVRGMEKYAKPLKLTLKQQMRVGQTVYAVGSPIGLSHTFTAGVVSALRDSYIQTDATIHSGSSGGPLVDQCGALCAIVTLGHSTKDHGFAQYSDVILEVLNERRESADKSPD
jgi:S1-C subfamily serine protease